MVHEIKNIVAIVTGGSNGIGAATVKVFLEEGAKHVAIVDVNETLGTKLQDELQAKYGAKSAKFYKCDVTSDDQLFAVFQSVQDEHGCIDLVVNNAGVASETRKTYKKGIDVNFTAKVTSTFKAIDMMSKDQGGRGGAVINVSSMGAITQSPILPVYCASKAGILHFSYCMGSDKNYSETGVRVMSICFAGTNTEILLEKQFDKEDVDLARHINSHIDYTKLQSTESAGRAIAQTYQQGESGSVWLSQNDTPSEDITDVLNKSMEMYGKRLISP